METDLRVWEHSWRRMKGILNKYNHEQDLTIDEEYLLGDYQSFVHPENGPKPGYVMKNRAHLG